MSLNVNIGFFEQNRFELIKIESAEQLRKEFKKLSLPYVFYTHKFPTGKPSLVLTSDYKEVLSEMGESLRHLVDINVKARKFELVDLERLCRAFERQELRRQGQLKKDGGQATEKGTCPYCGEYLQAIYKKKTVDGKRTNLKAGVMCSSDSCDYVEKEVMPL